MSFIFQIQEQSQSFSKKEKQTQAFNKLFYRNRAELFLQRQIQVWEMTCCSADRRGRQCDKQNIQEIHQWPLHIPSCLGNTSFFMKSKEKNNEVKTANAQINTQSTKFLLKVKC